MDRDEKALGIVIQSMKVRENDRLLTILSPFWGLVKVLVYGARKSIKAVKAPLYGEGTFILYHVRERESYSLKAFDPLSLHEVIGTDYAIQMAATLFSELVLLGKGADAKGLYPLYTTALDHLEDGHACMHAVISQFVLRYYVILGLGTDFNFCPVCGNAYREDEILGFSSALRIPCCAKCDTMQGTFPLPREARRYLSDSLLVPFDQAMAFRVSENQAFRISRYLVRMAGYMLDSPIKSLKSGLWQGEV